MHKMHTSQGATFTLKDAESLRDNLVLKIARYIHIDLRSNLETYINL